MAVDAGTIYAEVRIALDKLSGDVKGVQAQFDKVLKTGKTTADDTERSMGDSFKGINLAAVAAMAGITVAIKSAISTFAGFEQSMANTRSVTGATAEEFAMMEAAAEAAGKTTRYTASQAADGMYYLASAGYNATQVVQALDGVLKLAGATQSDLATTSASVAATISQFALKAYDAAKVANVFAAAITGSQANMQKLTDSMVYVGPIAGGFGRSIEETVGALEALYNAGFQGSQAGTALREVLSYLADSTGPVVTKLQKLGLTFDELNPQTHSIAQVIGTLADAGLTTADAISIFGQRAGPGLSVLLRTGQKGLEDFTASVTGTQKASEAYATQLDTLSGDYDIMRSAAQNVAIQFGQVFEPAMRGLVQLAKQLLDAIAGIPGPLKLVVGGLVVAVPVTLGLTAAMTALGVSIGISTGGLTLLIGGLIGLGAGLAAVSQAREQSQLDDMFAKIKDDLASAVVSGESLPVAIKRTADETGLSVKKVTELANQAHLVSNEMKAQVDELVKANALQDAQKENAKEILAQNTLMRADLAWAVQNGADLVTYAEQYAQKNGVALSRVIAVAQSINGITDAQKEQLKQLQDKISADERYQQVMTGLENDRLERAKLRTAEIAKQIAKEQELEKQQKEALQAEIARQQGIGKAREKAEEDYRKQLEITATQFKVGRITEADARDANKKALTEEIDSLIKLGYTGDLVAEKLLNNNGEVYYAVSQGNQVLHDAIQLYRNMGEQSASTSVDIVGHSRNLADEYEQDQARMADTYQQRINAEIAAEKKANDEKKAYVEKWANIAMQQYEAVFTQIGKGLVEGQQGWKDFGKVAIHAIASIIRALGQELAAKAIEATVLSIMGAVWNVPAIAEAAGGAAAAFIAAGIVDALADNLATGGIVLPSSGGKVVRMAENGYGELALNSSPEGSALLDEFANRIASAISKGGSGGAAQINLMLDGKIVAQSTVNYINNGNVRLNR